MAQGEREAYDGESGKAGINAALPLASAQDAARAAIPHSHGCSKIRNVVFDPKCCFFCKNKSRGDFFLSVQMSAPWKQQCYRGVPSSHPGYSQYLHVEGQKGHRSGGDPPGLLSLTSFLLPADPSTMKCLGRRMEGPSRMRSRDLPLNSTVGDHEQDAKGLGSTSYGRQWQCKTPPCPPEKSCEWPSFPPRNSQGILLDLRSPSLHPTPRLMTCLYQQRRVCCSPSRF